MKRKISWRLTELLLFVTALYSALYIVAAYGGSDPFNRVIGIGIGYGAFCISSIFFITSSLENVGLIGLGKGKK